MKKIILIGFMLFSFSIYAQNYKLGKVTVEELKEKVHPTDTTAAAAILFTKGITYFDYKPADGFSIVTEVEVKIKVYKKEGYSWGDKEVPYYVGEMKEEKVQFYKAFTYNLVNGEIEKSKLKNDAEFIEKVNKFWNKKKIAMPNVKEGSIIEYSYIIRSPFFTSLMDWSFQKTIPVNYSEYQTQIPDYFVYNSQLKGALSPTIVENIKFKEIKGTVNDKLQYGQVMLSKSEYNFSFNEKITTYSIKDMSPLKAENYCNNIENYTSSVMFELSSIQYPNQAFTNYATDWETVVKNIYENEDFGNQLNKTNYFEDDLATILEGVTSNKERLIAIFNFVKDRMSWNGFNNYNCIDGVKTAYKNKVGNVAEINMILIGMLRSAGIEVNPVILSTQSNGIKIFPSRTAFNYVIAGVELENKVILLDATNKNTYPDILPIRALNWIGRIIRKDGSSEQIDLIPTSNSKDIINIMASINSEGEVSGKIKEQFFDYKAFVFRENNNGITKDSHIEKLEKKYQGLKIVEYDVQNSNDLSKPVIENYSFTINNSVDIIGDKMYLSPFLFFAMTENQFKQEIREYPVDFNYPSQEKFNISLTIPDGYTIETLPQPKAIAMPDKLANFKFNISNTGNQLQILYTLDINQAIISSDYYESLKNLFKEIVKMQTEKIVLKKV